MERFYHINERGKINLNLNNQNLSHSRTIQKIEIKGLTFYPRGYIIGLVIDFQQAKSMEIYKRYTANVVINND
ncbi:hypothetical protein AFL42_15145 [Oceanobacillus caeni]|uniref:Uncharacterized protein n=1 Tax=Oceanobacillus caeni TaxID=405946 RepID=A0ABR5MG63_9BACI|nr:hypothetical protein AFL42_15145 [Oceanobacillus caeni]